MTLTSQCPKDTSGEGADKATRHFGPPTEDAPGALRAFTFEIDPAALPDMVRAGGTPGSVLLWRNDLCILGVGQALRVVLPAPWASPASTSLVRQALGSVLHAGGDAGGDAEGGAEGGAVLAQDGPLGAFPRGPVAMGALPYDPTKAGHLVVPKLLLARSGERAWATLSGAEGTQAARADIEERLRRLRDLNAQSEPPPDGFNLTASMPHERWTALVERTLEELASGKMAKVVLARRVDVVANRPFVLPDVLARLASLYPSCAVFRVGDFIGASPEILLRRAGRQVLSHPLAGTAPRSGEDATDEAVVSGLMASPKHRREHQLVVEEIAERLRPLCSSLEVPAEPSIVALRNVSHLGTRLSGTLAPSAPARADQARAVGYGAVTPSALELAALLQPTPAVGGYPRQQAISWQQANEGFDRGLYAGPVGWVDASGDGEWVLGLRSARVDGQSASLYAGNGIVAGSVPQAELAETQLKLQALLAALVRP